MIEDFQILDGNRRPLEIYNVSGTPDLLPYHRFEHRVTLGRNFRKFWVLIDQLKQQAHIEEITDGRNVRVDDDNLWGDLYVYAEKKGFLQMQLPMFKEQK